MKCTVGAGSAREKSDAVCLMNRSEAFAADDRSYRWSGCTVGAGSAREKGDAVCLMNRGGAFAADDRSYGEYCYTK